MRHPEFWFTREIQPNRGRLDYVSGDPGYWYSVIAEERGATSAASYMLEAQGADGWV